METENLWKKPKQEDKYRIRFKCSRCPDEHSGLAGFKKDQYYTGRAYNGLFEIAPDWGRGRPSVLLRKVLFERYFEVLPVSA